LFSFALFAAVACNDVEFGHRSNAQALETPADPQQSTAEKLIHFYDQKNCTEFVKAFPDTFQKFDQVYGYDDSKGPSILYSRYEDHLPYFFHCSAHFDITFLDKVIGIGVNGKWDADAPGLFQDLAYDLILEHPSQAKEILDNLDNNSDASFWFFLCDGPHPSDKENVRKIQLLAKSLDVQSKQSRLLTEEFRKSLAREREDKDSSVPSK
jgi:hypothetical protein